MNLLLIGSGAREHAIARALAKSPAVNLYNIGTHINPGIESLAQDIAIINVNDHEKIIAYAQSFRINCAIIGPEKPLESGLADSLWQANIPVIGPTKQLAQIETSKGYARDLMKKYEISGLPFYQRFTAYSDEVKHCLTALNNQYVVKVDGLMSGKGVKVAGDHLHSLEEAIAHCQSINGPFVIEEKLIGQEFSLLSFSDGKTLAHMPPVRDHKRLLNHDEGPNTGGMGTYTLANHRLPFLNEKDIAAAQKINEAIIAALFEETGEYYRGIIYGGFIKTNTGIYVIEFNARFGDPEAINLLGLLETPLATVFEHMITGKLAELPVSFKKQASVCKYIVPYGYPDAATQNTTVNLNHVEDKESCFYGSLEQKNGALTMLGSRALAVLAQHENIAQAEKKVEEIIAAITGEFYHRSDIGKLKPLRIAILGSTQGSNLPPLYDQIVEQKLPVEIGMVLSDLKEAPILAKAASLNIPNFHVTPENTANETYSTKLNNLLQKNHIDFVILMGFKRILFKEFTDKWAGRAVNIHPSLLPKYANIFNLKVHQAVLDAQDSETGCTVHWLDEQVDAGQIIVQKKCLVAPGETADQLKQKVQKLEVDTLIDVLKLVSYYQI